MSNPVVDAAVSQLGKPYRWDTPLSATDPNPKSFDCSGLTMWCYRKAGIKLPHQSQQQFLMMKHRPFTEAEPGDLVFFRATGVIYHVAIYVGGGQIIEAPDYGIPVRYRAVNAQTQDLVPKVGVYLGNQGTDIGNQPSPTATRETTIYDYLALHEGYGNTAISGVMGNSYVETGGTFDPTSYNPKENALGIAQWEGDRLRNLQQYAVDHNGNIHDLNTQLGFMDSEIHGGYGEADRAVRAASTPEEAALAWASNYEHNDPSSDPDREKAARQIYQDISDGTLSNGGTNIGGTLGKSWQDQTIGAINNVASKFDVFGNIWAWFQSNLKRIGLFLAGGIILLVVAVKFFQDKGVPVPL